MSLLRGLAKSSFDRALGFAKDSVDVDAWLQTGMGALIEAARVRSQENNQRYDGGPLKLFFTGYSGSRNTGADVRVEEMLRQFRHVLGDENLESTVTTLNPKWTEGYFRGSKQIQLPKVFPKFLYDELQHFDGVVACEGSMFKSKFADALTTMMAGSLGLALAEKKLAIGYGGEAGDMTERTESFVRKYAKGAYVIARNEASAARTAQLGMRTAVGSDTAWTFGTSGTRGEELLAREGWDGSSKVIGIAPIHPFFWPVKPSLRKAMMHEAFGAHASSSFDGLYFHNEGPEIEESFRTYIGELRRAILAFRAKHKAFVVLIGMEAVDRIACERLQSVLPDKTPMFIADDHDMFDMIPVLRRLDLLVSSRYHGIVCSMPHLVPSIGVTMDERIRNLMQLRGDSELCFEVSEARLGEKLGAAMLEVFADPEKTRAGIEHTVFREMTAMGKMGGLLVDHVRDTYPKFPVRNKFGRQHDPLAHLPELPRRQRDIVAKFAGSQTERSLS